MPTERAARVTGVWISAASASVIRWGPDDGTLLDEAIESDVPGHHRSTGRPPTANRPAKEGNREEHLRAFFVKVMALIPDGDDLLLIGDGEVVEHLATKIRALHGGHDSRRVEVERSAPMTGPQLAARLRAFAGYPSGRGMPQ